MSASTTGPRFIAYAVPPSLTSREPIGEFPSKAAAIRAAHAKLAEGGWLDARIERQTLTWVMDAEWNEVQRWVGDDSWTIRSK